MKYENASNLLSVLCHAVLTRGLGDVAEVVLYLEPTSPSSTVLAYPEADHHDSPFDATVALHSYLDFLEPVTYRSCPHAVVAIIADEAAATPHPHTSKASSPAEFGNATAALVCPLTISK